MAEVTKGKARGKEGSEGIPSDVARDARVRNHRPGGAEQGPEVAQFGLVAREP
ncbi:hypothetical protein ABZ312_42300 [Streptomyces sp. NPDC006207]